MTRSDTAPFLLFVGIVLLAGAAGYLLVNHGFDKDDFQFDTYSEDSDDYL